MRATWQTIGLAVIVGLGVCCGIKGQPTGPFHGRPPHTSGGGSFFVAVGGGGYGGGLESEPGSVVDTIALDPVREELHLSSTQQQQTTRVLDRVRTMRSRASAELWKVSQARSGRSLGMVAYYRKYTNAGAEVRHQLAQATQAILAQLSPSQREQLQALCRQAAANAARPRSIAGRPRGGTGRWVFVGGGSSVGSSRVGALDGSVNGGSIPANGTTNATSAFTVVARSRNSRGTHGPARRGVAGSDTAASTPIALHFYERGGGRGGVVRVISDPRVQQRLRLNREQRTQINTKLAQVRRAESNYFALNRTPWPERLRQNLVHGIAEEGRLRATTRQAVALAGEEIKRFLEPAQRARLDQICLQALGTDSLFKPRVIRALGLSAMQQLKLASLRQQRKKETYTIRAGHPPGFLFLHRGRRPAHQGLRRLTGFRAAEKRVRAVQEATNQQMVEVLTPAQQDKLKQILGKSVPGVTQWTGALAGGTPGTAGGTSPADGH